MGTYKLEINLIEVREIEVKANSEQEAISKIYTMGMKELEKLSGKIPETTTGWDYIRTIE